MRSRAITLFALAVLTGTCGPSRAQKDEVVSYLLFYPDGVRTVAMGTTGVADNSDPCNIFFNPANVVASPRIYLRGSYWNWDSVEKEAAFSGGGSWQNAIGGRSFEFGADVAVGLLDYSDEIRTIYLPEGNGQTIPGENVVALTLGAGTTFGRRWETRLGLAGKRYWEGDGLADGYGFDVGTTVACRTTASGWDITPAVGLAFVNLGTPLEEADQTRSRLPARFHYGFSVRIESPEIEINKTQVPLVAITCNLDGVDRFYGYASQWSFGSEFALAQVLFLRAGTIFQEGTGYGDSGVFGYSAFGVGLGCPVYSALLRFDYAKVPLFVGADDRYQLYLEF